MSVRKTLHVEDAMCCEGCAENVRTAVTKMDGVEEVTTDHATDEVDVVFDERSASEDDITNVVREAGCGMS